MTAADSVVAARDLLLAGKIDEARTLVERAADEWHDEGDPAEEARCRRMAAALGGSLSIAKDPEPTAAQSALVVASQTLDQGDLPAALTHARRARAEALAARSPLDYVAAAFAIAELSEAGGDRGSAYESLAVGWVTLADLVGAEAARAVFAPSLIARRDRWGASEFAAVKARYEESR